MDARERAEAILSIGWTSMTEPLPGVLDKAAEMVRAAERDARAEAVGELAVVRDLVEEDKAPPRDWYPLFVRGNPEAEKVYRNTYDFCASLMRQRDAARAQALADRAFQAENAKLKAALASARAEGRLAGLDEAAQIVSIAADGAMDCGSLDEGSRLDRIAKSIRALASSPRDGEGA